MKKWVEAFSLRLFGKKASLYVDKKTRDTAKLLFLVSMCVVLVYGLVLLVGYGLLDNLIQKTFALIKVLPN